MKYLHILTAALQSSSYVAAQAVNPDLPNPELLTKKYLEEIAGRKVGQSRFAHKVERYHARTASPTSMESRADAPGGAGREIQEADVFKLGKKGKKELFLLNNYRGFQVVSFEDGLERPKLKGRLPIYNNWSSEMYHLEAQDKVLIVNTEWTYSRNHWATNYSTKVYLMDVKDTSAPKIVKELSVPGYLSESRLVGDVLYTITTSGGYSDQKAQITSLRIDETGMDTIDSAELHGENQYVQTMNVVQQGEKYLVISTQTRWNVDGDTVNVHDISSSRGDITKLLTAKARGRISERSNTFVHKGHLFAVSNYRKDQNSPQRISVEAFPLEASQTAVVSKENMRVSIGDTTGLHASLQDVRVSGDMLYAFWVPANNIDPFELFDISEPSKGIKHLGQLQFDGWISKAFPMEHAGKKYVLGLGEIVPATREDGKRFPQAKIFEIKKVGEQYKHEVVASLTIDSEDVWSRLNEEDKYFEMVQEAPGVFNVLFPVYFQKTWKGGAKIVTADLNAGSLSEGASVTGDEGWLKRVFLNKEVRSLSAFSDEVLESFRQDDMSGRGFAKSVSVLELARDVVDFHLVSATEGLQVVSKAKHVEIHKVNLTNSDAELADVLSVQKIKGKYEWHKVRDGKMFVVTSFTKKEKRSYRPGGEEYEYEVFDHAVLNVLDLATGSETAEKIATTKQEGENRYYYYFQIQAIQHGKSEILKINNEFFRLVGNSLKRLEVAGDCQYFFDAKSDDFSLETVGDEVYAFTTFSVKASDDKPTRHGEGRHSYETQTEYELPFTKKLTIDGAQVSCSASVNVPGRPVLAKDDLLITSEMASRWYYYGRIHYDYVDMSIGRPYRNESKTFSLKFTNPQEVTMVDMIDKDITNGLYKDGFMTFDSEDSRLDLWRVTSEGEFLVRPQFLKLGNMASMITQQTVNGRNLVFMKNASKVELFEVIKNQRVERLAVTSTHDDNKEDGSAENIFAIRSIVPSADGSRFHISQGMFGVTDIVLTK